MTITRVQAQKLCNAAEMELVGMSLGDTLKSLSAVQLRGKLKRVRTLRDELADQFRRQSLAMRTATGSKRGNTSEANARTEKKLQLFSEVLARFEKRGAQVEAQAERAAAAAAKAAAKPVSQKVSKSGPASKPKATASKANPPAKTPAKAGAKTAVKAAVKAALKRSGTAASGPGKAATPRAGKAPAVKRSTAASKVVAVRGKAIGAHARAAQSRSQAKRDKG